MSESKFIKRLSQEKINSIVKNKILIGVMSILFYVFGIDKFLLKQKTEGFFQICKIIIIGFMTSFFSYFFGLMVVGNKGVVEVVLLFILVALIIACSVLIVIDGIKGIINGVKIIRMSNEKFASFVDNGARTNTEVLRYRNNKLSYNACLSAIVFQCISFIAIYSALTFTAKFTTGLDVVINIIFLLVTFLTAEKVKTYNIRWGVLSIVVGTLNLVRIFTYLYSPWSGEELFLSSNIATYRFHAALLCYVIVWVLLVVSGITTIIRGRKLNAFLKESNKEVK